MSKQYTKLANRYGAALLKATMESGAQPVQVAAELQAIATLCEENAELSSSLQNPLFSKEQRAKALSVLLKKMEASDILQRFIAIVFERERIAALSQIAANFSERVERASGVKRVQVTVARELVDAEKAEIEQTLQSQIEGRLEYQWSVQPEILGGLIVEFDGRVMDGSVGGRLERLERQLLG